MNPSAVLKEGHKNIILTLQIVEKVRQQLEKKEEEFEKILKILRNISL
jgi:hypothetical protein